MTSEQDIMTIEQRHSDRKERRRLEGLWWAIVLIWAGLVFGADSIGYIPQVGDADSWSWIFLGAGVFGTLGNLYRVSSLNVPNPSTWDWIWSSFCLIIGLGGFITVNIAWPLILILVGGGILISVLLQRN